MSEIGSEMGATWEKTMARTVETTDGHRRSFAYGINMAAMLFPAGASVIIAEQ
jgi:hypothetical protein